MNRTLIFLIHTVTLAGLIALEFAPNKYVANLFVLFKTAMALEATLVWIIIASFASKLPSPSSINNALTIVRDDHAKTPRWISWIARAQIWTITVTALAFGQWFVFMATLIFIGGMRQIKPSAEKFLRYVKVDLDKKSAIIEV